MGEKPKESAQEHRITAREIFELAMSANPPHDRWILVSLARRMSELENKIGELEFYGEMSHPSHGNMLEVIPPWPPNRLSGQQEKKT